jgi:hypothetical protein
VVDPQHAPAERRILFAFVLAIGVVMLIYSQTLSFTWDEGFHLLAAQLILAGKKPYIDFFHGQTPLYAYWNAFWMRLLGQSWKVAHALSTVMTTLAVLLIADFTFSRLKPQWRLAGAIVSASLFTLNVQVFQFGTVGQAYGLCLFLSALAFRLAIRAVERESTRSAAGAGFCAGAAACSSLLTAALAPILLVWIFLQSRRRAKKVAAFLAAGAIPFFPLFWFLAKAPVQTWFDVVQYHVYYRAANVQNTTKWDIGVIGSWLDSSQAVLLGAFALAGLWYIATRSEWSGLPRREFYLCGWLAAGQGLYLSATHPTFPRYFLFIVPFLSVLAAVGVYAIGSRVGSLERTLLPTLAVALVTALGLVKTLADDQDTFRWSELERVAAKVNEVTPPGASLWADEHIYFLTKRIPPPGLEFSYSHTVNVDPAFGALVHVVPRAELIREIADGDFETIENADDEDEIDSLGIPPLYRQHTEIAECDIFWDLKKPQKR